MEREVEAVIADGHLAYCASDGSDLSTFYLHRPEGVRSLIERLGTDVARMHALRHALHSALRSVEDELDRQGAFCRFTEADPA